MADNRSIVYIENGMPIYRASSIGQPLRCLTAARMGGTPLAPPEYLVKAAAAGTAIEAVVKNKLTDMGYSVGDEQGSIEVPVMDDTGEEVAIIRGHLDAMSISIDGGVDHMLEVKSMSSNVWAKWQAHRFDRFPTYAHQLSVYMHASGKPAIYAIINRDTDELEILTYDEPPIEFDQIALKVLAVEAFAAQSILPPCTGAEYQCSYSYQCDRGEMSIQDLAITADQGDDERLVKALATYDAARNLEDAVKVMKADARDEVLAGLAGREQAQVGLQTVKYTTSTSKRLSVARLRDHLGGKLDEFYDTSEYKQLRVSKLKGGTDD